MELGKSLTNTNLANANGIEHWRATPRDYAFPEISAPPTGICRSFEHKHGQIWDAGNGYRQAEKCNFGSSVCPSNPPILAANLFRFACVNAIAHRHLPLRRKAC